MQRKLAEVAERSGEGGQDTNDGRKIIGKKEDSSLKFRKPRSEPKNVFGEGDESDDDGKILVGKQPQHLTHNKGRNIDKLLVNLKR